MAIRKLKAGKSKDKPARTKKKPKQVVKRLSVKKRKSKSVKEPARLSYKDMVECMGSFDERLQNVELRLLKLEVIHLQSSNGTEEAD